MTLFEFAVPAIALAVAGVGIAWAHWGERRLDREMAEAEKSDRHR